MCHCSTSASVSIKNESVINGLINHSLSFVKGEKIL